jgi:RNA polymerase sigma factor (TIGR02999 family)
MMRRILVDHARRRKMVKRSGGWVRVTLDAAVAKADPPDVDLLDLDAALTALAAFDERKSRVAELRFFGGLSVDEAAGALGISGATADREWQVARAWLYARLMEHPTP